LNPADKQNWAEMCICDVKWADVDAAINKKMPTSASGSAEMADGFYRPERSFLTAHFPPKLRFKYS
jgi:hypothetical protein